MLWLLEDYKLPERLLSLEDYKLPGKSQCLLLEDYKLTEKIKTHWLGITQKEIPSQKVCIPAPQVKIEKEKSIFDGVGCEDLQMN